MPCSQIPAGRRHQAIRCLTCCLPSGLRRRLPRQLDVGTQSHSLQPRCLRFAARVTPEPRKTRFRLAANLDRMGLDTHRTPRMVSVIQFIHPPSPSFPSAQVKQAAARTTRTPLSHNRTPPSPRQPTCCPARHQGISPETPHPRQTAPPQRPGSHHLSHHHARQITPRASQPRLPAEPAPPPTPARRMATPRPAAPARSSPDPGSLPAADALHRSLGT